MELIRNDASPQPPIQSPAEPSPVTAIAPAWHTALLIAGIVALSISGSSRLAKAQAVHSRLATYAATAVMEMLMLAWVVWGLRIRRVPLRSLFGNLRGGMRSFFLDLGVAFAFWLAALLVLGTVGIAWSRVESLLTPRSGAAQAAQGSPLSPARNEASRALMQLAPANAREAAAWAALCLLVGLVEESVFRGYFQRQFTVWARGNVAIGIVFSALLFGAAHGYQGLRSMVLLAVFGVLFSLLAVSRRSLRPCILAHSWNDLFAGLAFGILKLHHIL